MPKRHLVAATLLAAVAIARPAAGAEAYVRVVDVGNGLCVIARSPEGRTLLYDAGDSGGHCLRAVRTLVPGPEIDLVVLSHSDGDHIGEVAAILGDKHAKMIVHPGDDHKPVTGKISSARGAIEQEKMSGATVWNLKAEALADDNDAAIARRKVSLGSATATIIAGWGDARGLLAPGERLEDGERNNAVSVVVRFEYAGRSVLLTGDTVGRHIEDVPSSCGYAEKFMVEHAGRWPLKSDVLVGQHHGADNASANCFIEAVKPAYVVFSAGHKNFRHPRNSTVRRFLLAGVPADNILRTDRGDNEPWKRGKKWREQEWIYGAIKGCVDKPGDDDVEILLPDNPATPLTVRYVRSSTGC